MKSLVVVERFNKNNFHLIFLFLFHVLFKKENCSVTLTFPSSIVLPNNNFFIIEHKNIFIYDSEFTNIVKSYPLQIDEQIYTLSQLSEVIIKYQNDYIICLIGKKILFFDETGTLLLRTEQLIEDENYYHPTLAPIFKKNDNHHFLIGYFILNSETEKYNLKLVYYKISLTDNNNYICENIDEKIDETFSGYGTVYSYDFKNKGLSCEYMLENYSFEYYYLLCFLIIQGDRKDEFIESFYELTEEKISKVYSYRLGSVEIDDNLNAIQIKSITTRNLQLALISLLFSDNTVKYYKFDCKYGYVDRYGEFYESSTTNLNCKTGSYLHSMKLVYLPNYNNNIILSCINSKSTVQAYIFDDSLSYINKTNQFSSCNSIYGHSVVYSSIHSEYYIISDVVCGKYIRSYEPLVGELSEILESSVLVEDTETNKEVSNSIENNNQKEEEEKEEEEEEENEEIIIEEEEKKYEKEMEKENKVEIEKEEKKEEEEEKEKEKEIEIEKELSKEDETETILKTQKHQEIPSTLITYFDCSSLVKCSLCSFESYQKKLCIKCNNEFGFYYLNINGIPLSQNKYIECVNEETKPSNFYFNSENKDYEKCFYSCASCSFFGNEQVNNCTKCDEIFYTKDREVENSLNCVMKCKYYISDSGLRQCVQECPDEYNLFIPEINKCIDDCKRGREYKYRYNDQCYKKCPNNTLYKNNDYICKEMELNKCYLTVNEIPNNYLNDNFTIDKAEFFAIKYSYEFNYTNNHVSQYKDSNDIYRLTLYINSDCISDLNLLIPEINFQNCYNLIKDFYKIKNDENVIIAIFDKKIEGTTIRKILSHGMFYLANGKYLNPNDLCDNEKIILVEKVENKLVQSGLNLQIYKDMANEGINLFS